MAYFNIHHVGARFGNTPFNIPSVFFKSIETVLYDADDECVDELLRNENSNSGLLKRRVISACLANYDGDVELNLTVNASASSILEPSMAAAQGFVQSLFGIDWDVAECATVIERRTINCCKLDTLLLSRKEIPPPDFLSLDTQGSELAIIMGSADALGKSVVGLMVEVGFIEMYKPSTLFGEITDHLSIRGFHFAGFHNINNSQTSRQPIGMQGGGFPISADALFLRRVDSLDGKLEARQLARLAFASIVFGHVDHAFSALQRISENDSEEEDDLIARFLSELNTAMKNSVKIYLPKFPDILPKAMYSRFSVDPDISHWPSMFDLNSWVEDNLGSIDVITRTLKKMELNNDTAIESVLRKYGFDEFADKLNFRRRDQSHKLLILLSGGIAG